jgi:SEC-C motif domain protein
MTQPVTAEALMRSRYVAYARQAIDYLETTSGGEARRTFQRSQVADWARSARFTGLEIIACEAGGEDDSEGRVEFTATFEEQGRVQKLHERSRFAREHGVWRYIGSDDTRPVQRDHPKVGRNAPCPCGSGKKYKRCCGR